MSLKWRCQITFLHNGNVQPICVCRGNVSYLHSSFLTFEDTSKGSKTSREQLHFPMVVAADLIFYCTAPLCSHSYEALVQMTNIFPVEQIMQLDESTPPHLSLKPCHKSLKNNGLDGLLICYCMTIPMFFTMYTAQNVLL